MAEPLMQWSWYNIVGTVGVAIIVLTYVLLQTAKIRSDEIAYSLLNSVGAGLILLSLWYEPNVPSIVVESFWLAISLFGIGKYLVARR